MNKHYAIFDMDGTLVDSMGYWHSMEREFLLNKGISEGLDEILETTKPMTLTESCAYFSSFCGIDCSPEEFITEFESMMAKHYRNDVKIKP